MEETNLESVASPPGQGAGKSKLDTLSKEDLIKFAKRQIALLQKVKSKCADLEKEIDTLKTTTSGSTDDSIIQELTERMDAVLLEKAETQQNLVLLRKEKDKTKQQELDALEKVNKLQKLLDETNIAVVKYKEEAETYQKLLEEKKENEKSQELKLQEEVIDLKAQYEMRQQCYVDKISTLQERLDLANKERDSETLQLKEAHQKALSESNQKLENLQKEVCRICEAHKEEVRELTEKLEASAADFEVERERLLLLQDELTEQLALKESYLQDVQEEEEEPSRVMDSKGEVFSGLLGVSCSEDLHDELGKLRLTLEDLRSQNTMLQDEMTYLNNVKTQMELDLQQVKNEFQLEREELEFKINELQMCKEDSENAVAKCSEKLLISNEQWEKTLCQHEQELQTLKELHKKEISDMEKNLLSGTEKKREEDIQELQKLEERCEQLAAERNLAIEEYENIKEILQKLESEVGDRTGDFVKQYNAMKEQGASAIQELQQKLRVAYNEKDSMLEKIKSLELMLDSSQQEAQSAEDLKASLSLLQKKNGEILSLLQQKESAVQELREVLETVSSEKQDTLENTQTEIGWKKEAEVMKLELQSLSQSNMEMQQRLEESAAGLAATLAENEQTELQVGNLENKLTEAVSEKEQLISELKTLTEEVSNLKKQQVVLQEVHYSQSEDIKTSAEERRELKENLQSVLNERDTLKMSLDKMQAQLTGAQKHIFGLLEQSNGDVVTDTEDIPALLENLLTKALQEKQDLLVQSNEKVAQLMQEVEELRGQSEQQQAELQAHVGDLSREKSLLQASLDEVVSDLEALQGDLAAMKTMNEKIKEENKELLAQIAEAAAKLQEKENEGSSDETEKPSDERPSENEDLTMEKINIALLKELKDNSASSEHQVTELTAKLEKLQLENKDKNEKINKIKAVALKAKKELDISKKEVLALREEVESLKLERDRMSSSMKDVIRGAETYKNLLVEYDKQTEKLDKERERVEGAERQIGDLTKRLQTAVLQHEQLASEREDLMARIETLQSNVRQLEAQALENQKQKCVLEKDLEAEKLLKEQKMKENLAAVKEVEEMKAQLHRQKQQLQQTAQELEQLRKDAQQSSLMDMEMADYERLVKELNQKLSEKDSCIGELEAEIQTQRMSLEALNEEIASLKSLADQREEKASKMKQLLVKTKKDLADAKKHEVDQMSVQASLKGELEAHQQQLEDYKIQCCDLAAERHRLQEQLRTLTEQQQRAASSLQQRLSALQEECNTAKTELASTNSEFESYKVRVHNVLKQKKNKTSAQTDSDVSKQERDHMESMLEQLKSRLEDTQQSLQMSCAELQQLQTEYDTLLERHNKILQETVVKEAELRERLLSLQSEHMALKSEYSQTVSQLTAQADALRCSFREQVRHLQDEHRSTVETLQQQISRLESQLFHLQREPSVNSTAPAQPTKKTVQERKPADLSLLDLQSMAREEGEGMETTETESVSSAGTPLPSLEQLLTSPDPKQEPFVWQVEPTKDELAQKLNTVTRSMEHMNGLLHETEATNAILMEQITLLKSEVRRLERNQEREKSAANLEYLKNVLLQFIFLKSGSERQALLPVIHTMLQLSPEEKGKLAAIAQGEEEAVGSRGSGWTSYLHSWSGIR